MFSGFENIVSESEFLLGHKINFHTLFLFVKKGKKKCTRNFFKKVWMMITMTDCWRKRVKVVWEILKVASKTKNYLLTLKYMKFCANWLKIGEMLNEDTYKFLFICMHYKKDKWIVIYQNIILPRTLTKRQIFLN